MDKGDEHDTATEADHHKLSILNYKVPQYSDPKEVVAKQPGTFDP